MILLPLNAMDQAPSAAAASQQTLGSIGSPLVDKQWIKPLTGAQQMLRLLARWLPTCSLVVVADPSLFGVGLLDAVRHQVAVITRLRFDAALFELAPPRPTGTVAVGRGAKGPAYPPSKCA